MSYEFNPLHFTDCDGNQLNLGDDVTFTKGKLKGMDAIFVFCIPQHRYGFLYWETYEHYSKGEFDHDIQPTPFVLDVPNLDAYYTPKSKMEVRKDI